MKMRHGAVKSTDGSTCTITLDGVDVLVTLVTGASVTVGDTAVILQDGRRMVTFGSIPVPAA